MSGFSPLFGVCVCVFVVCCMLYALLVCVCVMCVCDLLMSKWMHTPIHTHMEAPANYHVCPLILAHFLP